MQCPFKPIITTVIPEKAPQKFDMEGVITERKKTDFGVCVTSCPAYVDGVVAKCKLIEGNSVVKPIL